MQNDISIEERIDNYLLGRMSEQERQQFDSELASDPELQKELESQRQVANAVQRAAMNSFLKQHAQQRSNKYRSLFSSTRRVIWTVTSIAAMFVLVIGFVRYNKTANAFRNEGLLAYNNIEIPIARDGNQIDSLISQAYTLIGHGEYKQAKDAMAVADRNIKEYLAIEHITLTEEEAYEHHILQQKLYDLEWLDVIVLLKQGSVVKARKALKSISESTSPYSIMALRVLGSLRKSISILKKGDSLEQIDKNSQIISDHIARDSSAFKEIVLHAESIKAKFGEFDSRYLDTLSRVVIVARSSNLNDEAIKYRSIHKDIVERKYGSNSFEFAEDIWRLGNLYDSVDYNKKYELHRMADSIYNLKTNSSKEYPCCDVKYTLYQYHANKQQWKEAIAYYEDYSKLYVQWIDNNWKGISRGKSGHANNYALLGVLYGLVGDTINAISNYKKSISIIEADSLYNEYKYSFSPYESLSVIYNSLNNYEEAASWRSRYVEILGQLKGYDSEDYITQLSGLRYNYYSLNNLDSIKNISHRLLDKIEHRDKHIGISIYEDTLYLNTYKDLVSFCSIFNDNNSVIEYSKAVLDYLNKAKLQYSIDYYYYIDRLLLEYHIMHRYQEEYSLYEKYEETVKRLRLTKTESYWSYLHNKIETLLGLSKIKESNKTINQLKILTKRLYASNSLELAFSYQTIAGFYNYLERFSKAQKVIKKCKRILNAGKIQFVSNEDSLAFVTSLNVAEGQSIINTDIQRAEQLLLTAVDEVNNFPGCEFIVYGALGNLYSENIAVH